MGGVPQLRPTSGTYFTRVFLYEMRFRAHVVVVVPDAITEFRANIDRSRSVSPKSRNNCAPDRPEKYGGPAPVVRSVDVISFLSYVPRRRSVNPLITGEIRRNCCKFVRSALCRRSSSYRRYRGETPKFPIVVRSLSQ